MPTVTVKFVPTIPGLFATTCHVVAGNDIADSTFQPTAFVGHESSAFTGSILLNRMDGATSVNVVIISDKFLRVASCWAEPERPLTWTVEDIWEMNW